MDHAQELRRAAAEAFMQAIAELETSLLSSKQVTDSAIVPSDDAKQQADNADPKFDLDALADAAADIEQFIQARSQSKDSGTI